MREYLGEPQRADDGRPSRQTPGDAEDGLRGRNGASLRAHPVNADRFGVGPVVGRHADVALTLDQLHHTLQDSLDYLEATQTPMTNSTLRLRTLDGVRAAVDAMSNGHPITRVDGGREPVWRIAPRERT